jgi:hypothetical protein
MTAFGATARTRLASARLVTKNVSATRFCQRIRDRIDTAAVGVALKDGRAIGFGLVCERRPIERYGGQIDLQDRVGFVGRRPVHDQAFRQSFVVDDKTASTIDDLPFDRAVDEDVRAFLDRQISDEVSANMQGAVLVDDRVSRDRAADDCGAIDDECPFTTGVMIATYNGRPHCQRPLQHR